MKLNLSEQFAVDANLSFLAGKATESLCSGDIESALGFLALEKERIAKIPKPIEPKPEKVQTSARIPFVDLTDVDHVCETCCRKEGAPFDYKITSSRKGQCDSCGSDAPLQSVMRFNQDMMPAQDFSDLAKSALDHAH